jgi:FlaA1/EpsC-like NDP-sugar epimerase
MQMVRGWVNSKRVIAMTSFGFRGLSFNDNYLIILRKIKHLSTKVPPWLLHRNVQMLLDSMVAATSLWIAYLLRFDFSIPSNQQRGMAGWLIVIAVARPATILLTDGYKATWRFFAFRDAIRLAARSVPVSICLLLFRAAVHNGVAIPFSVLLMELLLFLCLASALRTARRYEHEFKNRVGSGPNPLIVGSEATLAGAVRHLRASGNTNILGLVT